MDRGSKNMLIGVGMVILMGLFNNQIIGMIILVIGITYIFHHT